MNRYRSVSFPVTSNTFPLYISSCEWFLLVKMARKLTTSAVASLLNGGGGALIRSGDDELDVLTDYR